MALIRWLALPLRAPMLLVLLGVSLALGNHWTLQQVQLGTDQGAAPLLVWPLELLQVMVVVIVCTMPDLLMRRVSLLMASSRVVTLVVSLLVVVTCGLILMRTNLLMNVLILASAVLLARLDLARIGVVPPPLLTIIGLGSWVLLGLWLGHRLPSPLLFALG
ncbi:MAG: hypothetical protein ACPHAS_01310 [Synechococcus sp.]